LIKIENYVIDFALTPDKIWIVELNPWSPNASSGLFDWEKDIDILTGKEPFQFRCLTKPDPELRKKLSPMYIVLLNARRNEKGLPDIANSIERELEKEKEKESCNVM